MTDEDLLLLHTLAKRIVAQENRMIALEQALEAAKVVDSADIRDRYEALSIQMKPALVRLANASSPELLEWIDLVEFRQAAHEAASRSDLTSPAEPAKPSGPRLVKKPDENL